MKRNRLKWIIASVGISASLAAGGIHAQSGEGQWLRQWYQSVSQQLKGDVAVTVAAQTDRAERRVMDTADELAANAEERLSQAADEELAHVGRDLQGASAAYTRQLDETAQALGGQVGQERFEPYVAKATEERGEELERYAASVIEELTRDADKAEDGN
ncbi:hypothetical protein [Cohnella sp. 56]|uniref:hypothetical protein n=1 Tax=Cohnella sp. 56 TaxID=3113722 RepID=UPI0030EA2DE5